MAPAPSHSHPGGCRLTFVLVHSPLVGPASWASVASQLEARGVATVVPSLMVEPQPGCLLWQAGVDAIVEAAADAEPPLVLVAHSGAGVLLPPAGARLGRPGGYVFVDATLPKARGTRLAALHPALRSRLEGMAEQDMLPPWSEWWGRGALEVLIPDEDVRARFEAELRPVPLALFEEVVPVPARWPDAPCGYLRLSPAYTEEEAEAARRGWLVTHLDGTHLEPLLRPAAVARSLLSVVTRMGVDV